MMSGIAMMFFSGLLSLGPCKSTIFGRVLDARDGQGLGGARLEAGTTTAPIKTKDDGSFRIEKVCSGPVEIQVVRSNYALEKIKIDVGLEHRLDILLTPMQVTRGAEIRVEAPRLKRADTRSVVSLEGDALQQTRGENLADALANLPGVTVLRSGTTAKPVIRGQYGTRVLKLFDGVRHEGQDWGLEHGPEIDPFAAGSMRVIKGSAGVRYGPDAIAGVLLVDPPKLLKEPGLKLQTQSVGALNGKRTTFAAQVDGNHEMLTGLSWRIDGNYSRGAGLTTPDYPLDNTGIKEQNIGGVLEHEGDWWTAKLSYRRNETEKGVCLCVRNEATSDFDATIVRDRPMNSELYKADFNIDRPFQRVSHDITLARTLFELKDGGEVETTYAYQINDRKEYDIIRGESNIAQYNFLLRSHTADAFYRHAPVDLGPKLRLEGITGIAGMLQENVYRGRPLLTDYRAVSGGVFVIERLVLDDMEFETGLRYDHEMRHAYIPKKTYQSLVREGRIESDFCDVRDARSMCKSTFHAGTLSLGSLFRISEELLAKLDLSSATRMPTIDEQYINGTSPSFPIMARGRADLGPETSWSLSGTFEANVPWLSAEFSAFGSYIDDYIYLSPELRDDGTVRTDVLINGRFPRFSYDPIDAVFYGADANTKFRYKRIDLAIQGSVVRAHRSDNGEFLLFIPSDRAATELTYNLPNHHALRDGYVAVNADFIARQYNVSPEADFAPVPDGYILLGARAGTAFELSGQRYTLGAEVQNALNTRYRDYTSMLRYYADEPGLQAFLRFGTEFNL